MLPVTTNSPRRHPRGQPYVSRGDIICCAIPSSPAQSPERLRLEPAPLPPLRTAAPECTAAAAADSQARVRPSGAGPRPSEARQPRRASAARSAAAGLWAATTSSEQTGLLAATSVRAETSLAGTYATISTVADSSRGIRTTTATTTGTDIGGIAAPMFTMTATEVLNQPRMPALRRAPATGQYLPCCSDCDRAHTRSRR